MQCSEYWELPKNVHIQKHSPLPGHIKPTSQETLVAYMTDDICPKLFENLELTHSMYSLLRGRHEGVVREFEYHKKDGEIFYDISQQEDPFANGYARLITTNSWYMTLFKSILYIAFSMMDLQANFMLVVALFSDPSIREAIGLRLRTCFTVAWLFMLIVSVLVAMRVACKEYAIKVSPATGDLISHCSAFDRRATYFAMVAFIFFSVEKQVKDIVICLHPWKSVQPFAAIKTEGTRAFVVGYRDECLFRVENLPGQWREMPAQLISKTVVFSLKLFMFINNLGSTLGASCMSSVGSLVMGWRQWLRLRHDRKQLLQSLLKLKRHLDWLWKTGQWNDKADSQWQALTKLLFLHFRMVLEERKISLSPLQTAPREMMMAVFSDSLSPTLPSMLSDELCLKCGRLSMRAHVSEAASMQLLSQIELPVFVKLSQDYHAFHDAKYGPLKHKRIGKLIQRGPDHPGLVMRGLVESCDPGGGTTWWYDLRALRIDATCRERASTWSLSSQSTSVPDQATRAARASSSGSSVGDVMVPLDRQGSAKSAESMASWESLRSFDGDASADPPEVDEVVKHFRTFL